MEKEQIFKTNKVILIMHSIISAIMIVGLVYELTQPTFNAVTFVIRMVLVLGSYVVGVVLFVRNKTKNIYSWCSSIGFSVVYAVYLFLGGSLSDIFPYYIVLMMCYVLTMNTALVRTTSGILLVINIARCVMSLVTAHNMPNVYKDVFFQLIVTVLVCLAAVMGQGLGGYDDYMQIGEVEMVPLGDREYAKLPVIYTGLLNQDLYFCWSGESVMMIEIVYDPYRKAMADEIMGSIR